MDDALSVTTRKKPSPGGRKPAGERRSSIWSDLLGEPVLPERAGLEETLEVAGPYNRYLAAKFKGVDAIPEMQRAMLDALRSSEPLPDEMRFDLAVAFEMVISERQPDLFAYRRQGPPKSLLLVGARKSAVLYIRGAKRTKGQPTPEDLVAKHFGVTKRSVGLWLKEFEGTTLSIAPEFDTAETRERFMLAEAQLYRRHTRNKSRKRS